MSNLFVPGPISGKNYRIKIKGDAPTADERQQIEAFVRQSEGQFAEYYQSQYGEDLLPSRGAGGQLSEFFRGIPRGAGGLFETAALGAASPLQEGTEDRLREGIRGIGMNLQDRFAAPIGLEDTVGGRLGEAFGSMAAIAGSAGAAGLATANPFVGFGTGLALGTAAGAGEARERARAGDATLEERNLATQLGLIPGAAEAIPLVRLNRVLERGGFRERLQRALLTAGEEGVQEAASGIAQNLIEQNIYNPERGTFEGTGEDLGYGAGAGALVQAITDLMLPGRLRSRVGEGTLPDPEAAPTVDPTPPPAQFDPASAVTVNPVVAEARSYFEERATNIADFALVPREEAEARAAQDTLRYLETSAQIDNPVLRPLIRSLRQRAATVDEVAPDMGPPTPPLESYADMYTTTGQQELTLDTRAETPTPTQEIADAETAPSGPVDTVTARDRDGVEGRVEEPRTGDVTSDIDTTRAQPPVGDAVGEPVLGTRGPDAPEGAQPAALTVEPEAAPVVPQAVVAAEPVALELTEGEAVSAQNLFAELYPTSRLEDFAPSEAESAAAENLRQMAALYDQQFAVRPDEAGPSYRRTPAAQWSGYELSEAENSTNAEERAAARRVREAQNEVYRESARRIDDTRFIADEFAEQFPNYADMIRNDPFPFLQAALSDTRVPRIEEGFSPQQAAPVAPEPTGPSLDRDALPGAVTGTAGQIIPPPILGRPVPLDGVAAPLQQTDPAVDAVTRQIIEAQEQAQAAQLVADWFDQNASEDLRSANEQTPAGERETSPMSTRDLRAVFRLVSTTKPKKTGVKLTDAQFAQRYFGRTPDAGYALHMIAHDAAQARAPEGQRIPQRYTRENILGKGRNLETEPLQIGEAGDVALLEGHGWEAGERAARWVEQNLSPEGVATLIALRDRPATNTTVGYANLDYGQRTRSERRDRDIKSERRLREMEADQARALRQVAREDTAEAEALRAAVSAERPVSLPPTPWDVSASLMTWPADAHPRVGALLRAGRFRDAVRVLAATAPNQTMRELAARIASRVDGTPTQVVSPAVMNRIRAEMSPETPTLGIETPAGVYVHPRNAEQLAAMRREGHEEAASIAEEFGGQILFNENTSFAPELVMHEAAHAVGDAVLSSPSHPLTRQLDKLRIELLKFMPVTNYGLSNVREFFAEGMSNPAFRRDLSYATAEGRPISAWQQFKNIVRNWLRGMIGREPIKADTALSTLDRALDAIIAMNPNEMGSGSIVGASFAPNGAQNVIREAFDRTRVPTAADVQKISRLLQNTSIPATWKNTFMRLTMPLDYVADVATKYLPSARKVFDLMQQQQADIQRMSSMVMQSTEATAQTLAKYRRQPQVIDDFNVVMNEGSRLQVDPRKPRSEYEGYSFQYNVLDADGNVKRRVESKRYKSERERNKAIRDYNAALLPDERANPVARAKRAFDESVDGLGGLQNYDFIRARYDRLPADVKPEVSRMFGLQPAVGKELVDAIRARLQALLPQNRALQDKVFGMIYDKMLSGQMLDPYIALRRTGQYWLSYNAVDPLSITRDPDTGQIDMSNARIELFKESFGTQAQRQAAIDLLQQLPADQQVSNIAPYENVGSRNSRPTVPLEFVSGVLDAIDTSQNLADMVDPNTGESVKQQIIELMFDTLPESSFMNSFKRREGIRGFIGDTTPISRDVLAGDVVKNMRESAMRVGRQAVDLKYGAEYAAVRKALGDENTEFQNKNPQNLPVEEIGRVRAEVSQYHGLLTEYTAVPFRVRSNWSRKFTGGTYMLTLGLNASTALITLSQVPLFVAPFLSGKHGMGRTMSAIGEANRLLAGSGRERTIERIGEDGQIEQVRVPVRIWDFSLDNYDFNERANQYLATLHDIAKRNGVFNRSLMQDELLGEQPTFIERMAGYSGLMQHHAERYSREVALMSSYHLELQSRMGQQSMPMDQFTQGLRDGTLQPTIEQAREAALESVNVSEKTNGPIYAAAGPMASQGDIGSILFLFKRHPLSMMNLIVQTAIRATPLGSNDPADQKIAQRQAAGMIGMISLMSGALGLPFAQQVGWLYDLLFADDDEPDFDTVVRTSIGEAGAYGLIDYLTGMKVSERIGLGGPIYRPGFASENQPIQYKLLEGFGGPVIGLGNKYLNRVPDLWKQGEYRRFLEAALPSSVANVARADRFRVEGIRTMRGDPIVDDIGPFHLAAQALGFMPTQYAQRLAINSAGTRINNSIDTSRRTLLQRRNKALRDGDFDTIRRVDELIDEFNQRHPRNAITGKTKRDSIRAFNDRTARTNYGLAVSPRNQAYINELSELYGKSSVFK